MKSALYLITGFLGAGKTTFLQQFVRLFHGKKLAMVINEFGREDVDGQLLRELHAKLESIHSGSIFCACRLEQFEHALTGLLEDQPDVVLVETSGLSDPTNIREVLSGLSSSQSVDYRGCICVVDALNFSKVYVTALACRKQLAVSDVVVLNKIDLATPVQTRNMLAAIRAARPGVPVLETSSGRIPGEWRERLLQPDPIPREHSPHTRDLSVQSYILRMDPAMPKRELETLLESFAANTHRIKGFVRLEGRLYLVDCVSGLVKITPYNGEPKAVGRLVVLAGQGQPAFRAMEAACRGVPYRLEIER